MIANKSWYTVNSLFTDTSTRWTPRVGSCLSLLPLFDTLCPKGVCVKADFHERESRSRSCDQKCRAYDLVKTVFWFHLQLRCLRSAYVLVKVYQIVGVGSRSRGTKPITKHGNMHCGWFILLLLLPTPTIWFSLDHRRNVSDRVVSGVGRNGNVLILLTPIPLHLWLWFFIFTRS